jgi:hypothetical protein
MTLEHSRKDNECLCNSLLQSVRAHVPCTIKVNLSQEGLKVPGNRL